MACLQFMELGADPGMLIIVELPVGPLLEEEVAQALQGGGGQVVGVLLHQPHHPLRLVDEGAPALRHQAASQLHLVHLLRLHKREGKIGR